MSHRKIHPRKRFGQHFLNDPLAIQNIVNAIAPINSDHIVEIGPGLGALTKIVLPHVSSMDVIELDRDLIPSLKENCDDLGKLVIHQADALDFDFKSLYKKNRLRIIGNLPYNISTPLIFHLLNQIDCIEDMHFMLQKEVVERMSAHAGDSAYGRLSIMVQYFCEVEYLFTIYPQSFSPPPKVDSAIVRLKPYKTLPFLVSDFNLFADVVRNAFSHRRKVLRNALRNIVNVNLWDKIGINPECRPEEVSVAEYVKIANYLSAESIS